MSDSNIAIVSPIEEPGFWCEYKNKNQLTLTLKDCKFYGFKQAKVWELTFGEYCEGSYGSDVAPTEGECHYMCMDTEYFPEDKSDLAVQVFGYRAMSAEPWKATDKGFALDSFLEKDPEQQPGIMKWSW